MGASDFDVDDILNAARSMCSEWGWTLRYVAAPTVAPATAASASSAM